MTTTEKTCDEQPEPVQPKSRGKRALELLPELLAHIEYLCVVACKKPEISEAYTKAQAIVTEK